MSVQIDNLPAPPGCARGLSGAGTGPLRDPAAAPDRVAVGLGLRARLLVEDWYRLRTMMLRQVRHAHQP